MCGVVVLLDFDRVVLEFQNRGLVIIHVAVVGSRENCYHSWELLGAVPLVQFIAIHLNFVGSDDTEKIIVLQKVIHSLLTENI